MPIPQMDQLDLEIYRALAEGGPTTLSEVSRATGKAKSTVFRRVLKLSSMGVLEVMDEGGVVLLALSRQPRRVAAVGIMKAAEYPYVVGLLKKLRDEYGPVHLAVYRSAWDEAQDLISGKIQLAMIPVLAAVVANRVSGRRVMIIGGGSAGGMGVVSGTSGSGHAVMRMSNTELCAEGLNLEAPRVYQGSAEGILEAVLSGRAREGVVWEPYLTVASERGARVEMCELEHCCLLAANSGLMQDFKKIYKMAEGAISEARRVDPGAYAQLVGLPAHLLEQSLKSYRFMEGADAEAVERSLESFRRSILPRGSARDAVFSP